MVPMDKQIKPLSMTEFDDDNTLIKEDVIPKAKDDRVPTDRNFFYFFWICIFLLVTCLIIDFHSIDIGTLKFENDTKIETSMDFTKGTDGEMEKTLAMFRENLQRTNRKNTTHSYDDVANILDKLGGHQQENVTNNDSNGIDGEMEETFGMFRQNVQQTNKRNTTLSYDDWIKALDKFGGSQQENVTDNDSNGHKVPEGWKIVLACLSSIGVIFGTLYLFKIRTSYVVWTFLIAKLLFATMFLGFLWLIYLLSKESGGLFLFINIFLSILLFIYACVLTFMRKRIRMVILLFRESCKVLFAIPSLLVLPILTFLANLLILIILICTTIMVFSSGIKKELPTGDAVSEWSSFGIFVLIFNFIVAKWSMKIIADIQYTIIAGATSTWYFAKNKDYIKKPVSTSATNVFIYHLGTEVFGALVITMATFLRALIHYFTNNKFMNCLLQNCLKVIKRKLGILTKNAYILTAIHGTTFIESGERATEIIVKNAFHLICHDYFGHVILGIMTSSVIVINMVITYFFMEDEVLNELTVIGYIIVFLLSYMVVSEVFSVFRSIIDTIFICFCEDALINDGITRPYAMTRDLMEFIDNSKRAHKNKEVK